MLTPRIDAAGNKINPEYICPASLIGNWAEASVAKPPHKKFLACPIKFAAMCRNIVINAKQALREFEEKGSGKYRSQQERQAFESAVINACHAPPNPAKVRVADVRGERCASGWVEDIDTEGLNRIEIAEATAVQATRSHIDGGSEDEFCGLGLSTKEGDSVIDEWRGVEVRGVATGADLSSISGDEDEYMDEAVDEGIIVAFHAKDTVKGVRHAPLHLLLATKIQQASDEEIHIFDEGAAEQAVVRVSEEDIADEEFNNGCMVRLKMPYGAEYVVPYTGVQGRILADTGSTTTLINEEFAARRGLVISESKKEVKLHDVNNGESTLKYQCFFRLTLTTIWGDQVTTTLRALCVKDLCHDLLLGMRDLERYQVSVVPHRGEAQMQIGRVIEVFPMLDVQQIKHLQELTSGDRDEC